jgi:putative transposase
MDMPMKKKRTVASQVAARGPLPALPEGLIDQLVKGPMTPAEVQDLMLAFNKALIERATSAEMNLHLGYRPGQPRPDGQTNERFPNMSAASPGSMSASLRCTRAA